jgi:hypothetical protein
VARCDDLRPLGLSFSTWISSTDFFCHGVSSHSRLIEVLFSCALELGLHIFNPSYISLGVHSISSLYL